MSNAGPSTAEPREDTPLLHADASPTSSTTPRDDVHDVEEVQPGTDEPVTTARIDKALKILFALTISVGGTAAAFNIASIVLAKYGNERFGYWDYSVLDYQWQLFWQTISGVALSIFNLIHISQRTQPLPALVNILLFGVDGVFAFFSTIDALASSSALFGRYCRANLDDPDPDYGRRYPGSLKECNSWEPTYQIVTWMWLCFEIITGLLMIAVAITCLVRVYKLRSRTERGANGAREGSRWMIPAGQLSFEVSVYWGAPGPRGDGQPRQNEPVEEGRQEA